MAKITLNLEPQEADHVLHGLLGVPTGPTPAAPVAPAPPAPGAARAPLPQGPLAGGPAVSPGQDPSAVLGALAPPVPASHPPFMSRVEGVLGRIGRGARSFGQHDLLPALKVGGEAAGSTFFPEVMPFIPGTPQNQMLRLGMKAAAAESALPGIRGQVMQAQIPLLEAQAASAKARAGSERASAKAQRAAAGLTQARQGYQEIVNQMLAHGAEGVPAMPEPPSNGIYDQATLNHYQQVYQGIAQQFGEVPAMRPLVEAAKSVYDNAAAMYRAQNPNRVGTTPGIVAGMMNPKTQPGMSTALRSVAQANAIGAGVGRQATKPVALFTGGRQTGTESTAGGVMQLPTPAAPGPTQTTETMAQGAAAAIPEVERAKQWVRTVAPEMGGGTGRWHSFLTGQLGTNDPRFVAFRAQNELIATALSRVHFGARGGGQSYGKMFQAMVRASQSPQDYLAAVDVAERWLHDYAAAGGMESQPRSSPSGMPAGLPPGARPVYLPRSQ